MGRIKDAFVSSTLTALCIAAPQPLSDGLRWFSDRPIPRRYSSLSTALQVSGLAIAFTPVPGTEIVGLPIYAAGKALEQGSAVVERRRPSGGGIRGR